MAAAPRPVPEWYRRSTGAGLLTCPYCREICEVQPLQAPGHVHLVDEDGRRHLEICPSLPRPAISPQKARTLRLGRMAKEQLRRTRHGPMPE